MNETKEHQPLENANDMDSLSLGTKNSLYHCQFCSSPSGFDANLIFNIKKMALIFYCSGIF